MSRQRLYTRELSADCETPVSVFSRFMGTEGCFLLESAERGEHWGRYSILGFDPDCVAVDVNGTMRYAHRNGKRENRREDVFQWLREHVIDAQRVESPLPFTGGAVGYFAYDLVHRLEAVPCRHDLTDQPMAGMLLIDRFIVFDNLKGTMHLCVRSSDAREAGKILEAMEARLRSAPCPPFHLRMPAKSKGKPKAHVSRETFLAMVEKAKAYIRAGDIFQVVLSQRFSTELACDPFSIYRAVRFINPSPYLFYLNVAGTILIGSSPEILVRKSGNKAIVRPIAGTRPRGATPDEDEAMAKALLADEKERAEHVMLVDLGRNDLGRVCRFGSVNVSESMSIERYSHVMHIVSQVEGELADGVDALDLLASTFPAGTVTGAPKVRAMQIIDELEPEPRGPYAGAVGHLSFGGDHMDTAIAIRMAVVQRGRISIQAGAGIVADSVPEKEYEECVNKAMAMFRAVELAKGQP